MKKRFIFIMTAVLFVAVTVAALLAINVSATPTYYNLWIGGERVTSDNLSGDGWKYEPETNTLVLNGFGTATLGYNVEKNPTGYPDGKTWRYAIIYSKAGT